MAKIRSKQVFKTYTPNQIVLFPQDLGEKIPQNDLSRVVDKVVEDMDLSRLLELYGGGGTSSYHPRMLLKILLYGYCTKIYTGRKIAKALESDIKFMWLSGNNQPNFRTINSFRTSKAQDVIKVIFKEVLKFLEEHNYIKLEKYFSDGSTLLADGNKRKMVWKKNAIRYNEAVDKRCTELFKEIDALNNAEDIQYGKDNEGEKVEPISAERMTSYIKTINDQLTKTTDKKELRKCNSLSAKMQNEIRKKSKYNKQIEIAGTRSGYNKTDKDATAMRLKNTEEASPAYNVLAGSENQFITGISIHQNPNDATCFIQHLEEIEYQQPISPTTIIADAGFGTEAVYSTLEEKGIDHYIKYPQFYNEQKKKYKLNPFLKENFIYDQKSDFYICPQNRELHFSKNIERDKSGYKTLTKEYVCKDCTDCPFYSKCNKSTTGKPRTIQINKKLDEYKNKAREKLNSETGIELRKQRSIEIESCFGDIKHNMNFKRFHLRGKEKVKTEVMIVAIAHNLRKLHIKMNQKTA